MSFHSDEIRIRLGQGLLTARQLAENMQVSQPTVSRALTVLGDDILRIGSGRSIQYALRDAGRGLGDIPVYRVAADGTLRRLGILTPVRPEGFVMRQDDGLDLHSDSLPWWLLDMRPQGFLGRAYAERHAAALGLPPRLAEWSDTNMLRALLAHGHDVVGNLLLGDIARERFIDAPPPVPVEPADFPAHAAAAERGDPPGSSAGGEQPKFAAFTDRHVLVKFTAAADNPVTRRWRDLLAAEHLAAQVLIDASIPAARSRRSTAPAGASSKSSASIAWANADAARFTRSCRSRPNSSALPIALAGTGGTPGQPRHHHRRGRRGRRAAACLRHADRQRRHAPRQPVVRRRTRPAVPAGTDLRHAAHGVPAARQRRATRQPATGAITSKRPAGKPGARHLHLPTHSSAA